MRGDLAGLATVLLSWSVSALGLVRGVLEWLTLLVGLVIGVLTVVRLLVELGVIEKPGRRWRRGLRKKELA